MPKAYNLLWISLWGNVGVLNYCLVILNLSFYTLLKTYEVVALEKPSQQLPLLLTREIKNIILG